MNNLQVKLEPVVGGAQRVVLVGCIDENSELDHLFDHVEGERVVVDMLGIERINSIGVHRWIPAITKLAKSKPTTVEALSYPMVQQANSIANLFGGAQVSSFIAPFYCGACRQNHTLIVQTTEVGVGKTPAKQCPTCQAEMELDELDSYFRFCTAWK